MSSPLMVFTHFLPLQLQLVYFIGLRISMLTSDLAPLSLDPPSFRSPPVYTCIYVYVYTHFSPLNELRLAFRK